MKKQSMDMTKRVFIILAFAACLTFISISFLATTSPAKTAKEINSRGQCGSEAFLPTRKRRKGISQYRQGCARHPEHC